MTFKKYRKKLTFAGGWVVGDDLFASDVDERLSRREFSTKKKQAKKKYEWNITKDFYSKPLELERGKKLINDSCMALNFLI